MATSDDHRDAIARIRRCKDYYEILQISREFSEQELKKQYRRLALLLHPDKNSEPGAAEAFKAVGNAYATLSDPQKRRKYDVYGDSQVQSNGDHHGHTNNSRYDYTRGFDSDTSAEEVFNMFFGGAFPTGTVFTRTEHFGDSRFRRRAHFRWGNGASGEHTNHNGGQNVPPNALVQLMPLIVLISLALLSYWSTPDPPFSLYKTDVYAYERELQPYQIRYFVKESFTRDFRGTALKRIESQVLDEYTQHLAENCVRERSHRDLQIHRAIYSFVNSEKRLEEAKQIKTPSCTSWERINRLAREVRYGYA